MEFTHSIPPSLHEPPWFDPLRRHLEACGLVEVSPIFLLCSPHRRVHFRGRLTDVQIRYPLRVTSGDDEIFLRSHGTDFNVVPPEWLRTEELQRVYALGPGLGPNASEHSLLLVQIFNARAEAEDEALAGHLRSLGAEVLVCARAEYGVPCIRLSALFTGDRPTGERQR